MAKVNTRKRGTYWEYYFEAAHINGKRQKVSKSGFSTKKDALEAGTKALAEYNNSGLVFTPTDMSVSDYLDYWLEKYCSVNLKSSTVSNYRKKINNHIRPVLGKYRLCAVNPAVLQDFINQMFDEGYSRNTLSVIKGILSNSFGYAVEPLKFIQSSPMLYVKLPGIRAESSVPTRESPHVYITREQMNMIFERFPCGSSAHIPLMFGYKCGLRHGEAFAVTWNDIDFERKTLTVNRQIQHNDEKNYWYLSPPKYNSIRTIELDDNLLELLKREKENREANEKEYAEYYTYNYADEKGIINSDGRGERIDFVTVRESGELISPRITMHVGRVVHQKLDFPEFDFHSLRHTHCTMLIEQGANPKYVQTRMGHKNIEMTMQVYNHVTDRMKEDGFKIINEIY